MIALVAANTLPLIGVLFLGWSLFEVMALFWAESAVVGLWTIARMVTVAGAGRPMSDRARRPAGLTVAPLVPFFCVHFGGFMFVHGIFVLTLFGPGGLAAGGMGPAGGFPSPLMLFEALPPWALLALVLSHGISFVQNFLWGGEWRKSSVGEEMMRPYARIIPMHIALIGGGFAAAALGGAGAAVPLALLILIKTGIDLGTHAIGHAARRARR